MYFHILASFGKAKWGTVFRTLISLCMAGKVFYVFFHTLIVCIHLPGYDIHFWKGGYYFALVEGTQKLSITV